MKHFPRRMFWFILGYGSSAPEYRRHVKGSEGVAGSPERRRATGPCCSPGLDAVAVGEWIERAANCGRDPHDTASDSEGGSPLYIWRSLARTVRYAAAGRQ